MAGDDDLSELTSERECIDEEVLNVIAVANALGSITLDISRRGLTHIPHQVFLLQHVEYVYLEGNDISHVPSELFEMLVSLKWLDLRNNRLKEVPTSIKEHGCLKTLLLEGNQLKELPCELVTYSSAMKWKSHYVILVDNILFIHWLDMADVHFKLPHSCSNACCFVKTLTGLNLQRNPLEFPPPKVLERGVKEILRYLRDASGVRDRRLMSADIQLEDLHLSDSVRNSSESDGDCHGSEGNEEQMMRQSRKLQSGSHHSIHSVGSTEDLEFPRPTSVSLHRHMSYEEYRQLQYEKFKRAGALGVLGRDKRKKKRRKRVRTPPLLDPLESRMAEEKRLAKLRELQQKQMLIEQRRKDQQLLDDWRTETKEMQRKHYIKAIKNAQQDFTDPSLKTPYDTDPNYMKVLSKEDRIKQEIKSKHEAMKQKMDPDTSKKMEQARADRDRQLMERIKRHTLKVQERKQRPRGNPKEEMESAKQDLKMASDLQREVNHRRLELEYRFRAFTGDTSPIPR